MSVRRAVRGWWGWPAVALFVGTRLATACVVWLVHRLDPSVGVLGVLTRWDATWNATIAEEGYTSLPLGPGVGHTLQSLAFFPVVPAAARGLHSILGISIPAAGLVVSLVCGLAATVLLWRLISLRFDDDVAANSLLLLLVSPFAFAFSLFYTEGPALLAVAACFLALDRGRWAWAGAAALVAGLLRPNGFLLVVPCAVAALLALRDRREWRALWAPALAPLGFLAWVAYVEHRTGRLTGYFTLQREGWGASIDLGRASAGATVDLVTLHWVEPDRVLNAAALLGIGGLGLFLAVRRRLDPVWIAYAAALVVLTLVNERQASAGRFLLLAFPLFVAFALSIPRRALPLATAMSAVAMGGLLYAALTLEVTP